MHDSAHQSPIDFSRNQEAWLNPFCKILSEGVQKADLQHAFDNVSIITFNYDRCIEHYIAQWLVNYARISQQEAWELTKKLTVIHPYGKVGDLPWYNTRQPVPFGVKIDGADLLAVATQIRTFTERVDDPDLLDRIEDELGYADRVVYLGFAYGSMNLELLTLKDAGVPKMIFGTAYKISEQNTSVIVNDVVASLTKGGTALPIHIHIENSLTSYKFLLDYWRLLSS